MATNWSYSDNTFNNATVGNYKKYFSISTYHDEALEAHSSNAAILPLYTFYHPLHLAYKAAYNGWSSSKDTKQGDTELVKQMLADLANPKIQQWDIAIQQFYLKGTPQYKALLPNGRQEFQKGSQQERIEAIETLILNIGTDANLATLKTTIQTFYDLLSDAQGKKIGKQSTTETDSDAVEAARVTAANAMYKNLGNLMVLFFENPLQIEPYFDLALIRTTEQTTFVNNDVKALKVTSIVKRTLADNKTITIRNTGTEVLIFYPAAHKEDAPGTLISHDMPADSTQVFSKVEFGNTKELPFINVINKTAFAGSFEMEIK